MMFYYLDVKSFGHAEVCMSELWDSSWYDHSSVRCFEANYGPWPIWFL